MYIECFAGKVKDTERINLRVTAELEGFGVAVCTNNTVITNARVNGKKDQTILTYSEENRKICSVFLQDLHWYE